MSEQRADEAAIGRRSFTTGVTLTGAAALGAPLTRASAQTSTATVAVSQRPCIPPFFACEPRRSGHRAVEPIEIR
jgi:hypothetical protein